MRRDLLWFFGAALGMAVVITLSNAGPDSTANAVLTLGSGGALLVLAFRSVWRIERRILHTDSPWTPAALLGASFIALALLQLLGLPAWALAAGMFAATVSSWIRGARLLQRRGLPRAAP